MATRSKEKGISNPSSTITSNWRINRRPNSDLNTQKRSPSQGVRKVCRIFDNYEVVKSRLTLQDAI
ncbi:hypothetical protein HanIR_Chr17g0871231 [Helianthus annuus]|nr:hypothetical protein HanIR_Chr17g0871231 [Helianthus annuus]